MDGFFSWWPIDHPLAGMVNSRTRLQKKTLVKWSDLTFTSQKPGRTMRGLNPENFLENLSQIPTVNGCFQKIRGTPKSSHFDRVFHYFHHPFWATPIFGNTQIAANIFQLIPGPNPPSSIMQTSACGAVVEIDGRRQHAHDDHELVAAGRPSQILPAKFQEPSGSNRSCSRWEGEAFPKCKEKRVLIELYITILNRSLKKEKTWEHRYGDYINQPRSDVQDMCRM